MIENLACSRGGRAIFRGLGAAVAEGGALILAGPNGAGKSTLLRALAGLGRVEAGDARYRGIALRADRIGFQGLTLYAGHLDAVKPAFTALETLRVWAALYGADPGGAARALDALGVARLADTPARALSAGQKRRLGLARLALIDRPLWLLDEPTVSLDAEASGRVAELARRRCATGGVVIVASHIDLALPGADRLDPSAFAPRRNAAGEGGAGPDPAEDAVLSGDAW